VPQIQLSKPPAQIVRDGVRVFSAPSGEQDFARFGLAVAVGVFEKQGVRRLYHPRCRRWRM